MKMLLKKFNNKSIEFVKYDNQIGINSENLAILTDINYDTIRVNMSDTTVFYKRCNIAKYDYITLESAIKLAEKYDRKLAIFWLKSLYDYLDKADNTLNDELDVIIERKIAHLSDEILLLKTALNNYKGLKNEN